MAEVIRVFRGATSAGRNDHAATSADPSDADLVAQAQADRQVFAALYSRYLEPVHRYCYRRLGNREAAEDATSLVFTKALAALPDYRAGSFRSWLFAIAHNVVADQLRQRHRGDRPLDQAATVPDIALAPDEIALAAVAHQDLQAILARLPDEQRQVIELRLAGLTGPEIGQVLGRSRAAVNSAQYRAMQRLRDEFVQPGESKTKGASNATH